MSGLAVGAAGVLMAAGATVLPADAALPQPTVVSENAADQMPQLVTVSGEPKPIADAITVSGTTVAAGGRFSRVQQNGQGYNRQHLVLFDQATGEVLPASPDPNNRVWALATMGDWIYVGGQFTAIGGTSKRNVVRINAVTGEVDPGFTSAARGRVNSLVVSHGRLFAGGSFARRLVELDPETGRDTGRFDLPIADAIPGAWGNVTIQGMAIDPAGQKLVATGNFRSVAGQSRTRLFVADISGPRATLDPWYYQPFQKACASTHPRRIAYLHGVDFSPSGDSFSVAATGQITRTRAELDETVCDAVGRFSMADDSQPEWINYTGGDSVWAVQDTGAAVYAQGHFQWLDNRNGFASQDGGGAARRLGIGAIDPTTGRALPWDPPKRAQIGGRALLATPLGLWVGSDSARFGTEAHQGLAFAPLIS